MNKCKNKYYYYFILNSDQPKLTKITSAAHMYHEQ